MLIYFDVSLMFISIYISIPCLTNTKQQEGNIMFSFDGTVTNEITLEKME
jgi:hypothetical protein